MTAPEGTPRLQSQLSLRTREHFWVGFLPPRPRHADGDVNGLQTRTGHGFDASQTPVEFFLKKQSVQRNAQHKTVCLFCKPRRSSPTWLRTCTGEPQVGNWEGRDGGLVSGVAWCQAEVTGAQGYWARIRLDRKALFLRKIFKANISRITKSAR